MTWLEVCIAQNPAPQAYIVDSMKFLIKLISGPTVIKFQYIQ